MMNSKVLIGLGMLCAGVAALDVPSEPPSTAFSYQGQLTFDGRPVAGPVDFRFKLYTVSEGGEPLSTTESSDPIEVSQGLFSTQIDFGADAFDGSPRWLSIEVRYPAWDGEGGEPTFVVLSPRQSVLAVPEALHAHDGTCGHSHSLDAADGSPAPAVYVDEMGRTGFGTTSPEAAVHIETNEPTPLVVSTTDATARFVLEGAASSAIRASNTSTSKTLVLQASSAGNTGAFIELAGVDNDTEGRGSGGVLIETARQSTDGDIRLRTRGSDRLIIDENGHTGVGRSPMYVLDVAEANAGTTTVRFGNSHTATVGDRISLALSPTGDYYPGHITVEKTGTTGNHANRMIFSTHNAGSSENINQLVLNDDGSVGIGTSSIAGLFAIAGGPVGSGRAGLKFDAVPYGGWDTSYAVIQSGNPGGSSVHNLALNPSGGRVAIGKTDPQADLDVDGSIYAASANPSIGVITSLVTHPHGLRDCVTAMTPGNLNGNAPYIASLFKASFTGGGSGRAFTVVKGDDSTVDHVTASISADGNAYFAGTMKASIVQIEGADVAERMPASEEIQPGMVTEIDPTQGGQVRLARGAYSPLVAGIVSGANSFAPGAILGNLPGDEDAPPIALAGRVYCWCDADANGSIQPGDLLTTSATPGHAMRATDRDKSFGAVIGKAMTALDGGRGLVMVLVQPR